MVAQVLFAGTEGEVFRTTTALTTTTNTAEFDTNFSRVAVVPPGFPGVQVGPDLGGLTQAGYHVRNGNTPPQNFITTFIEIQNAAGQGILRLRQDTVLTQSWGLQYWTGAVWTTIGAFIAPSTSAQGQPIDIFCKIHATLGEFSWWLGGTKIASLTGNTNFFSATIDKVIISNFVQFGSAFFSEHVITDVAPVGVRVMTLPVTGAGTTNTFTSGVAADIDDTSINDTDFILSNTANQIATFAAGNLSAPAAALLPLAYCIPMRASLGATGPQNAQAAIRSGSTNYFSANVAPALPTGSFAGGRFGVFNLDPDTGIAWTVAGMNAAEPGVKSIT